MLGNFEHWIVTSLQGFIEAGGYAVVLLCAFVETFPFIGNFIPGQTIMILAGWAAASLDTFNIVTLFISCLIAVLLGDLASYYFGAHYGYAWLTRMGKYFGIREIHFERAQQALTSHAGKTIILSRFTPVTRSFIGFLSGAGKMPLQKFLFYMFAGGIAWLAVIIFGGYLFGEIVERVLGYVGDGILIFLAVLAIIWFFKNLLWKVGLTWRSGAGVSLIISATFFVFIGLLGWYLIENPFTASSGYDVMMSRFFFVSEGFWANVAVWLTIIFQPAGAAVITVVAALLWFARFKQKLPTLAILLAGIGTPFLSILIKNIINRPRPDWSLIVYDGFSFPSNHAAFAAGLGIIIYLLTKGRKHATLIHIICVIVIALVGWSRIALGHHYVFDILFSYMLGAAVAFMCFGLLRIAQRWYKKPHEVVIPPVGEKPDVVS